MFTVLEGCICIFLFIQMKARKLAERSLAHRLALEGAILQLSRRLAVTSAEQIDAEINSSFQSVMQITGANRICWYVSDGQTLTRKYSIKTVDTCPSPETVDLKQVPFTASRLSSGEVFILRSLKDLPDDARDREFFRSVSIASLVLIPSSHGQNGNNVLSLAFFTAADPGWINDSTGQLGVLANVIAGAIERMQAETARKTSERRFQSLFDKASLGIALEDINGRLLFVNQALCEMLGYSRQELAVKKCEGVSHPADHEREIELFRRLQAGEIDKYQIEKRFTRKDGEQIWGRVSVSLMNRRSDPSLQVIGMLEDITEQKLMESGLRRRDLELEQLTGRLMQAQEEERQRISRELHDDVGQRMCLLTIGISALRQELQASQQASLADRTSELYVDAQQICKDLQDLTHEFHSTNVKELGLELAVRGLCDAVSAQHALQVEVGIEPLDRAMPPELALCLFRVAQEALNNVIKHGCTRQALLELKQVDRKVWMKISDSGVGFDSSVHTSGIGFSSMRERLRIHGGVFSVRSRPGRGTEVIAEVPLQDPVVAGAEENRKEVPA